MVGFDIDFSMFGIAPTKEQAESADERVRSVQIFKTWDTQKKMRVMSEKKLDEVLDWHFEKGCAYHAISYGDVDSLSWLRHVAKQQRLDYVMLSTWCMATSDAEEMLSWVKAGNVKRFDFYVGEIFKNGYRGCLDVMDKICDLTGGRVARVRNHSKLMAFYGERFDGVIESSANVDTNPRIEQTSITIDTGLADFYKSFFDELIDFDQRRPEWKPWEGRQNDG